MLKIIRIAKDFYEACRQELLVVSQKKTSLVVTSKKARKETQKSLQARKLCIADKSHTKYLGADATGASLRCVKTAKGRFEAASKRQARARALGRIGKAAAKAYKTAAWAQMSYGIPFAGLSDTSLARTLARYSTMFGNQGSCTSSTIGVKLGEEEDPFGKSVIVQVKEWLAWWTGRSELHTQATRAWVGIRTKLQTMGRKQRWRNARGPIAATILSLERNGWIPSGPARWKYAVGNAWFLGPEVDLDKLLDRLQKDAMTQVWTKASKHYQGSGLEKGVDYSKAAKHVESLQREAKQAEAGALTSILLHAAEEGRAC